MPGCLGYLTTFNSKQKDVAISRKENPLFILSDRMLACARRVAFRNALSTLRYFHVCKHCSFAGHTTLKSPNPLELDLESVGDCHGRGKLLGCEHLTPLCVETVDHAYT